VSLLTDVSSEMIFSVFAIFLTTAAGASAALLGLVEGFADLSGSSLEYLAGWLSDRIRKFLDRLFRSPLVSNQYASRWPEDDVAQVPRPPG